MAAASMDPDLTRSDQLAAEGARPPRKVLVVGASSSVGLAIVERFARGGADVLCTYNRRTIAASQRVIPAALDLEDASSIDQFVTDTLPRFGGVDVAVLLAGALLGKQLSAYTDAEIDSVVTINLVGQMKLIARLLPSMTEGSQILVMSSIAAHRGSFDPVYAASKGALLSFVRSLAIWLAPKIRANAIAPGLIEGSTMYLAFSPERRAHHLAEIPTRRFTRADEVADVLHDLAEPHWSQLNGACVDLNGGQHTR